MKTTFVLAYGMKEHLNFTGDFKGLVFKPKTETPKTGVLPDYWAQRYLEVT